MLRPSHRRISEMLGDLLGMPASHLSTTHTRKQAGSRHARRGRALSAEQLESRQLLTGLSFESVITTESNWPDGKSYGNTVAADAAGNTYMGGLFQGIADFDRNAVYPGNPDILTARGTGDAFLAKYSPSGQFLWARRMGGDSTTNVFGDDEVKRISTDNAGNVFLTGVFAGNADFGSDLLTSAGATDSFLAKVDPNGNFMWTKHWGTAGVDRSIGLVVDVNGDASVLSNSADINLPGKIISNDVRRFDAHGNPSWISDAVSGRTYSSLINDASGNLYVAGTFRGTVDLDPGPGQTIVTSLGTAKNSFISKISTSGTLQWATRFVPDTSVDSTSYVDGSKIAVGNDGAIAVLGDYQGGVQIGEGGNAFSLPSNQTARSFFATLDPSTGTPNAVRVYDGKFTDGSLSLIATKDGYTATSTTVPNSGFNPVPGISLASKGERDVWIMTLDQTGSVSWAGLVGGESVDVNSQTSSDGNGGVLITGYSASTVFDFDPHPSRTYDVSRPGSFVLKLKPTPATKFYVVDDASANLTFEYAADHSSVENYSLNSGNSTPRGAASTIVGDRTWVVDANRKVYVYDTSGGLLGSWTAGTLSSTATVEGIATNGTDVWIVDAKSDKVYKYAGAATRLSGSQNATSNFSLNSGNTSPKDIVTDGVSLWVVNDSTTDKVFKYTVAGSLSGSWTISSANSKPTGLTIDPANVSNIWIVDSGTDTVYQYTDAASRISGSQSAAATFALAAGNTNPQGIADPPAPAAGASSANRSNLSQPTHSDNVRRAVLNAASTSAGTFAASGLDRVRLFNFDNGLASNHVVPDESTSLSLQTGTGTTSLPTLRPLSLRLKSASFAVLDDAFASFDLLLDHGVQESLTTSLESSLKERRAR